jgi:hypothetical protein
LFYKDKEMLRSGDLNFVTIKNRIEMIQNLFQEFDFSPMKLHICWLALVYLGVMLAMLLDLITGVRKAKKAGIARTSEGYKRTCDKAIKYIFPMLCLSCIDMMVSSLIPLPLFTMALGAFNIFCEFKSVMEKTHEKKEIRNAEKTMSIILENKEDIAKAMVKLLKDLENEGEENGNTD